jgi:transcriptional regulator with XRE-family HTH domain
LTLSHANLRRELGLCHVPLCQVNPDARFDGGFLSHGQTLRPTEHCRQGHSYVWPKIFSVRFMAATVKPANSAELLRNRVRTAVNDRSRRRALMRAMGLKSQGTITQWLDGEHNPRIDKLDSIAAFLGVSVADLFVVQESDAASSPDTPVLSSLPSTHASGDAHVEVGLSERFTALEKENARLRRNVLAYGEALIELAGSKTGEVGKRAPRRRGNRGSAN